MSSKDGIPAESTRAQRALAGKTFEESPAGTRFRTPARTITEADLVMFVGLAGLTEPLFLDDRVSTSAHGPHRLVPGVLTYAYAEGLIMQSGVFHGTGIAFMRSRIDMLHPVVVTDTIEVDVEVVEAYPTRSGRAGVVTTSNIVANQDGVEVIHYSATRLIRGKPASP